MWPEREVVLSKVNSLVKDFVYKATLARGLSESIAATSGGKIFSFVSVLVVQPRLAFCSFDVYRARIAWAFMDRAPISTRFVWYPNMSSERTSSQFLRRCSGREMMSKK